jgi:hypothetical protein
VGFPGASGGNIWRVSSEASNEPGQKVEESGTSSQSRDTTETRSRKAAGNMLPGRERRRLGIERLLTRLVATCGIVAIGVALGAILASSKTQGWIIGLVVALVTVVLSAILWSSRQL